MEHNERLVHLSIYTHVSLNVLLRVYLGTSNYFQNPKDSFDPTYLFWALQREQNHHLYTIVSNERAQRLRCHMAHDPHPESQRLPRQERGVQSYSATKQ